MVYLTLIHAQQRSLQLVVCLCVCVCVCEDLLILETPSLSRSKKASMQSKRYFIPFKKTEILQIGSIVQKKLV